MDAEIFISWKLIICRKFGVSMHQSIPAVTTPFPPPPRPQGNRRTFAHVVSPRLFMCCHPCNFVNRLGETLSDFQFEIFLTISKISSNLPISSTRYCQSFRFVNTFLDLSLELGEAKLRCKLQNLEGGGKGSKP